MEEQLMALKNDALSLILDAKDKKTLEEVKLQFLGRSGRLTVLLKEITKVPQERRAEVGQLANEVKQSIEDAITNQENLASKSIMQAKRQTLDVTHPGNRPPLGHLHLITQAIQEITSIFEKIGFTRVRYPEIDWDYYAFTALNFPANHPARDDWETFFTTQDTDSKKGQVVLTPHTSNGQVREMERAVEESKKSGQPLSIRMLNIAKCYRRQSDVSHTQMFHQFEGLVVGENISIVHLKGVLDFFVKSYFGENRTSRIRPYHFQFTEPSFEVDVTCGVCLGSGFVNEASQSSVLGSQLSENSQPVVGHSVTDKQKTDKLNSENRKQKTGNRKIPCRLCKAGWLEMGGAGMVHPNVLRYGGVDTKKYTGFAFGWGVERVLMMKEGIEIDDLRLLYSNKLEFLEQF